MLDVDAIESFPNDIYVVKFVGIMFMWLWLHCSILFYLLFTFSIISDYPYAFG